MLQIIIFCVIIYFIINKLLDYKIETLQKNKDIEITKKLTNIIKKTIK